MGRAEEGQCTFVLQQSQSRVPIVLSSIQVAGCGRWTCQGFALLPPWLSRDVPYTHFRMAGGRGGRGKQRWYHALCWQPCVLHSHVIWEVTISLPCATPSSLFPALLGALLKSPLPEKPTLQYLWSHFVRDT